MAHDFDGPWSSFTIDCNGKKKNDGKFEFTIDEQTNKIKAGGKHKPPTGGETDVTGEAKVQSVDFKRIIIERGEDVYEGILVPGNGNNLVCGYLNLAGDDIDRREDDTADETKGAEEGRSRSRRRANQEQAIWVATKP